MKKKGQKQKVQKEVVEKDSTTNAGAEAQPYDEEVNSGFGSYLSSTTGKIFICKVLARAFI